MAYHKSLHREDLHVTISGGTQRKNNTFSERSLILKTLFICIATLIVGLLIGAWVPRMELHAARQQIKSLKKQLEEKSAPPSSPFSNIASMLPMAQNLTHRPTQKKQPTPMRSTGAVSTPEDEWAAPDDFQFDDYGTAEDALNAARDLWSVRQAQAREAMAENLKLTEDELDAFDELAEEMNDNLADLIQSFVDKLNANEPPTAKDTLDLGHTVTGVILDTYAELDTVFPSEWQADAGPDFQLMQFIDPIVAEPFLQVDEEAFQNL